MPSNMERRGSATETEPLLQNGHIDDGEAEDLRERLAFADDDDEDPRGWNYATKMFNVATIASMAILSPLASSMFTPGIDQIAEGLNTDRHSGMLLYKTSRRSVTNFSKWLLARQVS